MKRNDLLRTVCCCLAVTLFAGMAMASGSSESNESSSTSGSKEETTATEATAAKEEKSKEVEIVDTAYYIPDGSDFLCWCVTYKNNDDKTYYEFETIYVTLYDKDGGVISADEQVMGTIAPGETQAFAGSSDTKGKEVDKVEFTLDTGSKTTSVSDHITSSEFEFSDTKDSVEGSSVTITGKIKNTSANDCGSASTTVIFKKDGKMVGGYTTYIDNIKAGQERAFEISDYNTAEYDSYVIYAFKWY